jgi:hypothetical protein
VIEAIGRIPGGRIPLAQTGIPGQDRRMAGALSASARVPSRPHWPGFITRDSRSKARMEARSLRSGVIPWMTAMISRKRLQIRRIGGASRVMGERLSGLMVVG